MMQELEKKITLTDEQWEIVYKELPKSHPMRSEIKDLWDDAKTWGEAEADLTPDMLAALKGCSFDWLDVLVEAAT